MHFTLLTIILIVTVLVSMKAMDNERLKDKLMFIPYRCTQNKESYRVFSHILVHADFPHLLFNMLTLFMIGKDLELFLIFQYGELTGEFHFLILYILGAMFATIIPFVRNYNNYNYRSLGASGAVSAIVFAFIVWNPKAELSLMFLPIPMPAYVFGILYLVVEYYLDKKGNTGIAHDAHIGGAIFGVIYILIINIDKGKSLLHLFSNLYGTTIR
ncbi:MAG: rhomboid family intramembrane serine protease [Flavobacteriia bacterium]|nr:rhomboid family intramembrane serine protease [Flavobacteriia bacterium]